MPSFVVKYVNPAGKKRKEEFFAPDVEYLKSVLQKKKYWILSIDVRSDGIREYRTKLPIVDLVSILDQIEIQLMVNINIDDAFRNLANEFPRGKPKFVVSRISDAIDSNGRVADACGQFPKIFPDHVRQMIAVGEDTGKLTESFRRIIEYFQASDALISAVKSACMYPAMVLLAMLVFIVIIFGYTVPTMLEIFDQLGVELKPLTKAIKAFSELLVNHPILMALGFFAVVGAVIGAFKIKFIRPYVDLFLAKGPIIGPITRDVCVSRFAANLGALYVSEIPLVQGLTICSRIAGNMVYDKAIAHTRAVVESGRQISEGLRETKAFPNMVILTIKIGEENGKLADSLDRIANYYSRKAKEKIERALKIFEPTILVFLIVMVGFIAYALLTPMMDMIQQMSK